MYKIILADGTTIDNLELNGNNFIPETPIDANIFNGNLSNLSKISIIDSEGNIEELNDFRIVFAKVAGNQSFIIAEKTSEEKRDERVTNTEINVATLEETIDIIFGGM